MEDRPRHLVLVGPMGSGKSTIGAALAHRLGLPFRDNDAALEARSGLDAAHLQDRDGRAALHAAEAEVLLDQLRRPERSVIAAAASTVESPACRRELAVRATVVWLDGDLRVLAARASSGRHRPLVRGAVRQELAASRARRARWYRSLAQVAVDVTRAEPDQIVSAIHRDLAADATPATPPTPG
ncbi:MAG: shikimate kinase [Acidimicrobiales bacterium]